MSEQPVVYAVPTHLTTREPFVFGRSLDEFAKLSRRRLRRLETGILGWTPRPGAPAAGGAGDRCGDRLGAAARATLLTGQLARSGVPFWRQPTAPGLAANLHAGRQSNRDQAAETLEHGAGWQNLEHIRVRWAEQRSVPAGHGSPTLVLVSNQTERG